MSLDSLISYALFSFGSLFAILNPFSTIPPFLAMTSDNTTEEQMHMASRATKIALAAMVLFALTGMDVLNFFRVSVPAFRIAGGIVLLRASLEMLQGNRFVRISPEESWEGSRKDDISITPLAIPILCGPGSITTAILLGSHAQSWLHTGVLCANLVIIYSFTFGLLRLASRRARRAFGEITLRIVSRLMGLLLVAIAIQFLLDGILDSDLVGG